ncbi:MAG: replication initiation factor [Caudoviricetes sp.]|nr:MAG: replication initiation factor [Caudoviricetes sp.]
MAIERFVDYMQFSSHKVNAMACIELEYTPINPVRNYAIGYRTPLGIRVYFSTNPKNTPLIIASGEALQNLRDYGHSDVKILNWALEIEGKFSRIDLAVTESKTEHDPSIFTMSDVKRWVSEGLIDSPLVTGGARGIVEYAPKSAVSDSKDTIQTIYVGDMSKRGEKGIFRAYDKGIELGIEAENVISRIELEIKRDRAKVTGRLLANDYNIGGNFRARFNVNDPVFDRLMDSEVVEIKRGNGVKNKEENEALDKRWKWLIDTVAPSLKQAIESDKKLGRSDNLQRFLRGAGLSKEMGKLVEAMAIKRVSELKNEVLDRELFDISK